MDSYCDCCGAEPDQLTLCTTNLLRLAHAHDEARSQVTKKALRRAIDITLVQMAPVTVSGGGNVIEFGRR